MEEFGEKETKREGFCSVCGEEEGHLMDHIDLEVDLHGIKHYVIRRTIKMVEGDFC